MNGKRSATLVSILCLLLTLVIMLCPVVAQNQITIAATCAYTGPPPLARTCPWLMSAFKDCVAITNEEGGINGKQVRFVTGDDQYKGDVAVRVFKDMVSKYNPLCMFGSGTPASVALAPVIRKLRNVIYSSTSFSAKLAQPGLNPSIFVTGPTYGEQLGIALKYIAKRKRGARVAFFYTDTSMGKDPIPYGRILCRKFRLKLVAEELGDMRGKDFRAQIARLKEKNPDFVILHGWVGPAYGVIMNQCKELGLRSEIFVTIWGTMKSVVESVGKDGPSFLGVSPFVYWYEDAPMILKLRSYTAKHYPEVTYRPLQYIMAFTSGLIFVECLKKADKAGQLNYDGLVHALRSIKDLDTGGLTAPLTNKGNRFPVARVVKANPAKGIFETAPLPEGLLKWIRMGY